MYADNIRLLQPTILVARVCSVCPSALGKLWIPFSNKLFAATVAFMILCLSPSTLITHYNRLNDITAFTYVSNLIIEDIRVLTSLVSSFVFSEELVRFFVVVESVQRSLFGLNIKQPADPTGRSQVFWILAISLPFLVSWLNLLLDGHYYKLLHVIPRGMVLVGSFLKSRVLLDLLHGKFSLLVWHLDDLNDRWPLFLPRPADVTFGEFNSVATFRRSKFVLPSHDDRAVTAEKINEFNKAHLKLVYACRILQRMFSVEWFFIAISTALQIITFSFDASAAPNKAVVAINLSSMVVAACLLIVNLTLTTKIKEKSEMVAILVHDLLDEDRHSSDVVSELEQFSLSLVHRKTHFSAAGFFDFDLKLVSKMASLLAPIVLFLVQNQNRPRAGRRRKQLQQNAASLTTASRAE